MKHTYLSLIEQAYRLDQDARAWHDSIAEHAANVFPGDTGAMAYSFDATKQRGRRTLLASTIVESSVQR